MKKTFKIKGMHCSSCANLIENSLKDKVNNISISFSKEEAEIDFDESKISEKEIIEKIKELGYEACPTKSNNMEIDSANISASEKISSQAWFIIILALALVIGSLFYFNIINLPNLPKISIPQLGEKTSLWLLFAAGILTGFHCVSMCGAFVMSYTSKNAINGYKGYGQHFIYGFSKVFSYAIIGGIFGLIGGIFAFSIGLRGAVAIFAGIFMIFYALSMFGLKFFRKFQFNPKFLTKMTNEASKSAKGFYKGPFITGLLNGLFIACGPLQAMYLYAAGTGSFFNGAASLAVFGLGTLPVMIGFGSFATAISHKTTQRILKISAVIVLILGLIMLNRGLTLVGSNYNYESIKTKLIGTEIVSQGTNFATINNRIQEINMDVDSSGYSPNSFVLKKGVPVKWNINVKELTGCNSELILRQYNIDKNLKQGLNIIEFIPDKIGTITFTCGMGMLHGSFIVTDTGSATQEQVAAAVPKSSGSCSMGAGGGGCGCGM